MSILPSTFFPSVRPLSIRHFDLFLSFFHSSTAWIFRASFSRGRPSRSRFGSCGHKEEKMRITVVSRSGRELVKGGLELSDSATVANLQEVIHKRIVSDASQKVQIGARVQFSRSSILDISSLGTEEKYESACTSSVTTSIQLINQSTEKASSEWQSKGKRNSRPRIQNPWT